MRIGHIHYHLLYNMAKRWSFKKYKSKRFINNKKHTLLHTLFNHFIKPTQSFT